MKRVIHMFWAGWIVLALALNVHSGFAFGNPVEEAILKGSWPAVFEMLEKDSAKASDPVARLIMAQASLATNRNNASMLLFLSAKDEADLKAWSAWTESFLRRNPQNPIALYLSADAKARVGKLNEAIEALTLALKMKEDFALALNARGIVRVLLNEWDGALKDLLQATKVAPEMADAHANMGVYWILSESAEGALESFSLAIAINPEFALAYNGRGCAWFGQGEFEKAAQDFRTASQLSPALAIAEINQGFTSAYASQLITLSSMEKKPGTTLDSILKQYPNSSGAQPPPATKMLPPSTDQRFWKNIEALPHISDDQLQSLVKEYGLPKVQMGGFVKLQELSGQIAQNQQKNLSVTEKIALSDRAASTAFSSLPSDKKSWATWLNPKSSSGTQLVAINEEINKILNAPYQRTASGRKVSLYITDFGIEQWDAGLQMGSDFSNAKNRMFPELRPQQQILIPMPPDQEFKRMSQAELTQMIFNTVRNKIDAGIKAGHNLFEIQLVQHINKPGYADPRRQNMVNEFGAAAYTALGHLNDYLRERDALPYTYGICGSNGCKVFSENESHWKPYMRGASFYDGRAFKGPMVKTINRLGQEHVNIINTFGDWPAPNTIFSQSIGNHDVVKDLKTIFPRLSIYWIDPIDTNGKIGSGHLVATHPNTRLLVQYGGRGSSPSKWMTGLELRREIIPGPSSFEPAVASNSPPYKGGAIENTLNAVKLRAMEGKLNALGGISTPFPLKQASAQIPGYYVSGERPLHEIGNLAAMLDKTTSPVGASPRRVLIVSQDPFRSGLLQSELGKYGFQTMVIPPGTDPHAAAKQWGADAILGVMQSDLLSRPKYSPFPPGGGGGAAGAGGVPPLPMKKPDEWNWEPYVPSFPKGAPGGISTEEIARAFVDKGKWPVMTFFGLLYNTGSSAEEQAQEGRKQ